MKSDASFVWASCLKRRLMDGSQGISSGLQGLLIWQDHHSSMISNKGDENGMGSL